MKKDNTRIDLKKYLAIISILGFAGIFFNSSFGWNVDQWIDGLLYVIIGVALMISGGITLFFSYFKDGLDNDEISKILTTLIGVASFLTGLSIFLNWNTPIIIGIRAIVAALAIVIIGSDFVQNNSKCKR